MSKSDKYVPKHRAPGKHKTARVPGRALRTGVALAGLAAGMTAVGVSGGMISSDGTLTPAAAEVETSSPTETPSTTPAPTATEVEQRGRGGQEASRSASRRSRSGSAKATGRSHVSGAAVTKSADFSKADPRDIARALLPEYGFAADQFSCLDSLYVSESNWRVDADNPTSSAYGIPQALTQLHDLPADYMTSAESQIRWGLGYIRDTYGTPCSAWSFKAGNGWY